MRQLLQSFLCGNEHLFVNLSSVQTLWRPGSYTSPVLPGSLSVTIKYHQLLLVLISLGRSLIVCVVHTIVDEGGG